MAGRGVVRLNDYSTGHDCWPSRPSIQGSPDYFVDNRPVVRVGDAWATHCCTHRGNDCHDGIQAEGSPTFFVNNRPIARIHDLISCGDHCRDHSETFFVDY